MLCLASVCTAVDLISQMLVFNPENRCDVDQALAHPYLADLHDPNEEVMLSLGKRDVVSFLLLSSLC